MVIDLTRLPVVINTDVCPSSIVLRTARAHGVDGIPRRTNEDRWGKVKTFEAEVKASRAYKDGVIFQEFRLDLGHILPKTKAGDITQSPFEVATWARDHFSGTSSTWRVRISIEQQYNKNGQVWFVTLTDERALLPVVTLTAKNLARGELSLNEPLPLTIANKKGGPMSVWDYLNETTD